MKPTDALYFQRILIDDLNIIRAEYREKEDKGYSFPWQCAQTLIPFLPDAPTYYVSATMAAIAKHAAKSMPHELIRRDDCPSPIGFLLWDEAVWSIEEEDKTVCKVVGVAWADSAGMRYECDCDHDDQVAFDACTHGAPIYGVEVIPLGRYSALPSELVPLSIWSMDDTPFTDRDGHTWGHDISHTDGGLLNDEAANEIVRALRATWTLMGQSLSISEPVEGERAERRRWGRSGLIPQPVLVVRLRRLSKHGDVAQEDSPTWSHRWIVSGHWRNQWLPSRSAHRLQWIAAHVKGPESAPLVVKDRVTALVR